MLRFLSAVLFACLALTGQSLAQDRARTILVLDASGSMWGQIDGVAKITIAQQVIGDLLGTLPAEQELGLTAYGHRRKGDCSDIETLIAPGGDRRADIADAVNAIKPKGKTPLSAAVIAAAEALKYSEERATVILVSDGRETCEFDPCEVGRKLEESGVDFTAHVIGFDVADPADRAQLQCLAEATGGTFTTAANATELADALAVVAEPPAPPAPSPVNVTLRAVAGAGGPAIADGLVWALSDMDGTALLTADAGASPSVQLLPGTYLASVTRTQDGAMADSTFSVEGVDELITVVLPELPPEPVTIRYHATDGKNGPKIGDPLIWDIFADDGTPLVEAESAASGSIDLPEGAYRIEVLRPADEATAEARFGVGSVAKTVVLELPEFRPAATLDAPDMGVAGEVIQVRWTGPDARNDFIAVVDSRDGKSREYTYTREGPLLDLRLPSDPGIYELRYILDDGRKVLAQRSITVTEVTATITPPAAPVAGDTVQIDWKGPDYKNDFIAVAARGADQSVTYTYTRDGSPLDLMMPSEPGDYDIIYVMNQDRRVLARVPVTVTGISATISAPDTAVAGDTVQIDWKGPDYKNDFIAVAARGADQSVTYTYTRDGSPLGLMMPSEPGDYDIIYVMNQDRRVLARVPVTVTGISATIAAPDTAVAGDTVQIDWKGPDYKNDFIAVAARGADQSVTSTYTRDGSPLGLMMPSEPGDYDILYVMNQDRRVLARVPVTVGAVSAGLKANDSVAAGGNLVVEWKGPDYRNDYIVIVDPDDDSRSVSYVYTREGSPQILKAPDAPGLYELRYIMDQDRRILASQPLTVE